MWPRWLRAITSKAIPPRTYPNAWTPLPETKPFTVSVLLQNISLEMRISFKKWGRKRAQLSTLPPQDLLLESSLKMFFLSLNGSLFSEISKWWLLLKSQRMWLTWSIIWQDITLVISLSGHTCKESWTRLGRWAFPSLSPARTDSCKKH